MQKQQNKDIENIQRTFVKNGVKFYSIKWKGIKNPTLESQLNSDIVTLVSAYTRAIKSKTKSIQSIEKRKSPKPIRTHALQNDNEFGSIQQDRIEKILDPLQSQNNIYYMVEWKARPNGFKPHNSYVHQQDIKQRQH